MKCARISCAIVDAKRSLTHLAARNGFNNAGGTTTYPNRSSGERALEKKQPFVAVSSSGGARMQEGIFSLMQMAKASAAIGRLKDNGILYVSILCDPTFGGVTASFATLGDVIIGEPKSLIGFAGPRVVEQTIKQPLPDDFQRAEFLLDHGLVDMVLDRKNLRDTLAKLFELLS